MNDLVTEPVVVNVMEIWLSTRRPLLVPTYHGRVNTPSGRTFNDCIPCPRGQLMLIRPRRRVSIVLAFHSVNRGITRTTSPSTRSCVVGGTRCDNVLGSV